QDQKQDDQTQQQDTTGGVADKNARVPAVNVIWSPDSKKLTLRRRDERKVKDLWVINALANPRPTLETYRYAMPGEENIDLPEMYVFDLASKKRVQVKADRLKGKSISIPSASTTARAREVARRVGCGRRQAVGWRGGG